MDLSKVSLNIICNQEGIRKTIYKNEMCTKLSRNLKLTRIRINFIKEDRKTFNGRSHTCTCKHPFLR